jgi:nucleolar protein 4
LGDELELNGRRLIILKALKREGVKEIENKKKVDNELKVDKRNADMAKEGLVNTTDFHVCAEEPVSAPDMKLRIKLFKEKAENVRKNPNLSVSKTRLVLRNLPKRNFYEGNLK